MILILSKTYRESVMVAEDNDLQPSDWRHVSTLADVASAPRGTVVYRHAGAFERRDSPTIDAEIATRGLDVRDVRDV